MKDVKVTSAIIETLVDMYNRRLSIVNLKEVAKFEKENSIDFDSKLYLITIEDAGDVFFAVGLGYSLNSGNTIYLSSDHKAFINRDTALRYILYYLKTTDIKKFKKLHVINSCHCTLKDATGGLEKKFIYEQEYFDIEDIVRILGEGSMIKDHYTDDSFTYRFGRFVDNIVKKVREVLGRNS